MADPAQIDPTLESPEGSDDNRLGAAAQMAPTLELPAANAPRSLVLESPGDLERQDITLQLDPTWDSPEGSAAGLDAAQMIPALESPEIPIDCREYFADAIIKEVYPWITGTYLPNPRVRQPVNPKFILSARDKEYIQEFMEDEGRELKKYVGEIRGEKPWLYTDETYEDVKREVVNEHKPEVYSERGFVRLCAAVAIVVIGNQSLHENEDVADAVSEELFNFICQVLKPGGNIHHSEWAEDVGEQGIPGAGVGEL